MDHFSFVDKPAPHMLRAFGCIMGQLCGDALGSLVEFLDPMQIAARYPDGVRKLHNGGTWDTIAGQPTDDSEMALLLARMLIEEGVYDPELALATYRYWLDSEPFDCGSTIVKGLRGSPDASSQANGALMRIAPLAIFGHHASRENLIKWAVQDASLTHPNALCTAINAVYVVAIAHAIHEDTTPEKMFAVMVAVAREIDAPKALMDTLLAAEKYPPEDYVAHQGWVLVSFQNAVWQMLHANSVEKAIVDTVARGGDTDTNAAICGALMGAVNGIDDFPAQWIEAVLNCRPKAGYPGVKRPRPECFWPVDALDISQALLTARIY